jgi:methylthioribulose-1-phosphate dehydratase
MRSRGSNERPFAVVAGELAAIGRGFYERGWVLGTSGNFSAVVRRQPLELAISASGTPKGRLRSQDFLRVDGHGHPLGRSNRGSPSAETLLHVAIVQRRHAGAVLHTHSVWSTMLSEIHAAERHVTIVGYEMLKGLCGVRTHEHRELVPIVDNDQDMPRLAGRIAETLEQSPDAHAVLLRGHGLYTWGDTLDDAHRHVEIFEFLFETIGRTASYKSGMREERTWPS